MNKEPIRLWFPELNSYQCSRLREMLKEAEERGYQRGQEALLDELQEYVPEEIPFDEIRARL